MSSQTAVAWLVLAWLLWLARQDVETRRVSNWLTLPPLALALLYAVGMTAAHGLAGDLLTRWLFAGAALVLWGVGWIGGADAKVFMALALFDLHLAFAALAGLALLAALWPMVGKGKTLPGLAGFAVGVFVVVTQAIT